MGMTKAKVLIVDDAMLIRRLVADALAGDTAIEVVGDAPNGRVALQKIPQLRPDLVTLDIEMPEMDGLSTLRELRKAYPRLPVIMFSALTERGAADTLEALHVGASDYVTKPSTTAGKAVAQARIRDELVPKIRALCHAGPATAPPVMRRALGAAVRADVVAIALSTGGPTALGSILAALPADFPTPIIVVQHMPNMFTRILAERLGAHSALTVVEAAANQPIRRGSVYVAPGDSHLTVRRCGSEVVAVLTQDPPVHLHRPAADVLFRSVAEVYGARSLGVVLTGIGEDGLQGSEEIARAGGRVIVQDEATSLVWDMPGRVARAGLADAVVSLGDLASELSRRTAGALTRS